MSAINQITHVALLANPQAGNGKALHIANWLSNALWSKKIENKIFSEKWPSISELENFSDCWIIGGDGTMNYFINEYPDCKNALVIFDSGTGNDFAWKLYGDSNLLERFEKVLSASIRKIDAGKINDKLYINCMGVGFDGEIIKSMKTIRFLGGKIGYLLAVILKILSFKEPRLIIKSDEKIWDGTFLLALIVNSSRAGGGFYIAPDAKINDGYLDMVLCEALPVWKRLIYLPIIKKGKHMHLHFVKKYSGKTFNIQSDIVMPVQVDGELIFAKDITVHVMTNQFNFRY